MDLSRLTRVAIGVLVAPFVIGCSSDPVVDARAITLHVPKACAAPEDAYALLYAAGDFQPSSADPPQQGFLARDLDLTLDHLPQATRQLVADVSAPSAGDARWTGVSLLPEQGPVDLLLFPRGRSCALSSGVGARDGAALALLDERHVLVTGGAGNPVPSSNVVDLTTGGVDTVTLDLLRPRRSTTATSVMGPSTATAVVAGGVGLDGEILDSAEIFDLGARAFVGDPIALSMRRADHGAVALASGEVLLAGGRGASGPLASLEAIDPKTRRSRTAGLATLVVPRIAPTVMRLASGEILVAGGVDASGAPVATLEWLTADASGEARVPRDLVASRVRAFVALPAGGALAVVGRDDPSSKVHDVWIIGAGGSIDAAADIAGAPSTLQLFGGGGAPLLFTGSAWLRWDAWHAAFAPFFEASGASGPSVGAPALAPDSGLAMWLDGDHVTALRYDASGPYTSFPGSLLHQDTSHLSPDRAPGPSGMHFDPSAGLVLPSATSAFVDDATFGDVSLDLTTSPGLAPLVVLRDTKTAAELVVGGVGCEIAPAEGRLHVERRGAVVLVAVDGGEAHACQTSIDVGTRVALGVRGAPSAAGSVVKDLTVAR